MQNQVTPTASRTGTWSCAFCTASADHRRMGVSGAGRVTICDECVATAADALGCVLVPLNDMPAIEATRRVAIRDLDRLIAMATEARRELGAS